MRELAACATKTPLLIVDATVLRRNLCRMRSLAEEAGCIVLLKPREIPRFLLPHFGGFIDGTSAETPEEAQLGRVHLGGVTHLAGAAYREEDMADIAALCSHVSFGSAQQIQKHRAAFKERGVLMGLTLSPGRLGALCELDDTLLNKQGISGLRLTFPAASALDAWKTLEVRGKSALKAVRWLSFGQCFSLCGDDEQVAFSVKALREIKKRGFDALYLESGHEAARGAVHLVSTVLDVLPGTPPTAVLDVSAASIGRRALRPFIDSAGYPGEKPYNIRLCGMTGAQDDVFGDYSFDRPLRSGERLLLQGFARVAAYRDLSGAEPMHFLIADED